MYILKITALLLTVGLRMGVLGHPESGEEGRNVVITIVQPHEFSSVVGLLLFGSLTCGGSIINANWTITAASCTVGKHSSAIQILAGNHNINEEEKEETEQRRSVFKIIRHEKYNEGTGENDIALMQVSPPFELNAQVRVAELPPKGYTVDGNTVAIGWGRLKEGGELSNTLQYVVVPFVSDTQCQEAFVQRRIYDSMMCAGDPEGGKGVCHGDGGGPLHHNGKLVGLTSWGVGCARKGNPGVFTEVSYYIDWIEQALASN